MLPLRQNVVATGAGFVDGLGFGNNTKAAVIRLGLTEMIAFIKVLYPSKSYTIIHYHCGLLSITVTFQKHH